ncbi:MAG: L,D-transpeptidase [Chlamydiales bacterium]
MSKKSFVVFGAIGAVVLFAIMSWPQKREEVREVILIDEPLVATQGEILQATPGSLEPLCDSAQLSADVDRMAQIFHPYHSPLPIVETVNYVSRVPWVTGRSAFLGDYAAHYKTSKHFISRSLHGIGNYLSDAVQNGEAFNVLREDKEIEFHLVLDLSRLKMRLYYYDVGEQNRCLLKSYPVCCGELNSRKASGSLTPTGTFSLGDEIAVYREGMIGSVKNKPLEMVTVFGTRWIPMDAGIANCTGSCKGIGIHGVPWRRDKGGELVEKRDCMGHYEGNGCIRLLTEDMEELFALIVSRPAYIHIVKDFSFAQLPGKEIF